MVLSTVFSKPLTRVSSVSSMPVIHIFVLLKVPQTSGMFFCVWSFLDLIFSLAEVFISSTLSSAPGILSSESCTPLAGLTSEVLFDILKFSFPVLFQFVFSSVILFVNTYFHVLNYFHYFIEPFVFS